MKNNKGQSTVEYLLLVFVVVSMLFTVLQSNVVKNLLGSQGQTMQAFKTILERTHRHAFDGGEATGNYGGYSGKHDSYAAGADTRFFIPTDPYP